MSRFSASSLIFLLFALLVVCTFAFAPAALAQVVGPNVNMVSGTSWPGGDPFLQRQNEPSMAVSTRNPMHIFAGANDYRTVDLELALSGGAETGDSWLGAFFSRDGGLTWQSTLLPGCKYPDPQCNDSGALHNMYDAGSDPVVRAGTNGMFFYAGLAFDRATSTTTASSVSSIFVARYDDLNNNENVNPITYIDTHIVASGNASQFLDKPSLAVDIPRAGANTCSFTAQEPGVGPNGSSLAVRQSFAAGNVYMAYTDFLAATKANSTPTHLMFTRSTDCGVTWSTPVQINTGTTTSQGSAIAVNAIDGNVYVVWRQFASTGIPDAIMAAESRNAGRTFSAPVSVSKFQPFDQGTTGTSFRTNAYPSITTDAFGFVYVAFAARGLVASGDARVVAAGSIDGSHWTPAIMVDNPSTNAQTDPSGRGHQIMPAIAFANGRLTMLYYDLRLDHYADIYTDNPSSPTGYTAAERPEGELAPPSPMPSEVFTTYITDAGLTLRRHTLDLRVLELGIFPTITLGPSVLVSQYDYGCCVTPNAPDIEQFKFNVPNLPLFGSGELPFLGDYIDVVPTPMFVSNGNSWSYNFKPSENPLFHATWTDNRDVVPPANGDWTHYAPPVPTGTVSIFQPGQPVVCVPGQEGMRNQNIYTAQITGGLVVGAPGNAKPLGTTTFNGATVPFQRAFAVEAQNVSGALIDVRFSIANQPTGGKASFLQFSQLTTLDISIPGYSSVSRSVFVTSTNPEASVTVNVAQIGSIGGSPTPNGLSQTAVLNPDGTNPIITNPETPAITNPAITNYEVTNPAITNPAITNPAITNPAITNPAITNPAITNSNLPNPAITNVSATNPAITNTTIANPAITNPAITNPAITNSDISNGSIQDVVYPITNNGNTTSSYTVQVGTSQTPPTGVLLQLILDKLYETPVGVSCQLGTQTHWVTVANITAPKLYAPTDPQLGNPDITNSTPNEATMTLMPGETEYIIFRVVSPTKTPINPLAYFVPVAVPHAVNTLTVLANPPGNPPPPPPIVFPPPSITTAALPATDANDPGYATQFTAVSGKPGADTWTVSSGVLPTGLNLSPTGLLAGTPTQTGAFPLTIKATDGSGNSSTKNYTLTVNAAPFLLTGEEGLPGGVLNQAYGPVQIGTTGGTAPFMWSMSNAPAGLFIDPNTGIISGTPTVSGSFNSLMISARDSANPPVIASTTTSLLISANSLGNAIVRFTAQPGNSVGGQTLGGSPVQVTVSSQGAVLPAVQVTMSLNNAACPSAILSGTLTTQTNALGVASFPDLSIDRGGIGYVLQATAGGVVSNTSNAFTENGFCATGSLNTGRQQATATLLQGGAVLVVGGQTAGAGAGTPPVPTGAAELYEQTDGGPLFETTGGLQTPRTNHTATLLNDGTVVVLGGQDGSGNPLNATEIYSPSTGAFAALTGSNGEARFAHTATLLADGTVLIVGGVGFDGVTLSDAQIYNPVNQTFTSTGSMQNARAYHTATLLTDGRVLIAGGAINGNTVAVAEIFDPTQGTFTATGTLTYPRQNHTATLLSNGKVLIAGGNQSEASIGVAEIFDPAGGTFSTTGTLNTPRTLHTATLLTDGTVLLTGGTNGGPIASAEIYNPVAGAFANTGGMIAARYAHTATLLNDGTVLVAGGSGSTSILTSAELYSSVAPLAPMLLTTTAAPGTSVVSSSTAFSGRATNISVIGFNGILPAGTPFEASNPLTVAGVTFSTTRPSTSVNLTTSSYYSIPYSSDFIVDSSNNNASNQLTVVLPQPTQALGIDYGALGFRGTSTGSITLSNGYALPLASLPTEGGTHFSGFISSTPFSSLTYTVSNDDWVVTDLLLGTANANQLNGTEGTPFAQVLLEQGGVGPVTWTLSSGSLPTGVNLNSNGILSGTPTASGAYTFALNLADSSSPQKVLTSGNLTMNVVPPPPTNAAPGPQSYSSANLIWESSLASDVIAYNIYRASVSGGPYTKVASVNPSTNSYSDSNVQSGNTYYYVITAVGQANLESVYSDEVTVYVSGG
jgi:Putative Ig domain/Galactose oxidase, central domain